MERGAVALRPTTVRRTLTLAVVAVSLAACGREAASGPQDTRPTFEQLTGDPSAYDGVPITVRSGYLTSFEVSVLTSGFAESYPPQATQPQIWLEAPALRGPCVETAQGTTWSEDVVATGTFRYRADGGLGHLGGYDMALEDATVSCG